MLLVGEGMNGSMAMTLVIDRESAVPIHLQIREDLEKQMNSGELLTGARLPSMNVLSSQYGIAYGTIQRIISDMARDGLVRSIRGSGVFVCEDPRNNGGRNGELRLSAWSSFGDEDSAYLQNTLHKAAPGIRVVLGADNPDVMNMDGDDIPRLADELSDVSEVIEEVYGQPPDEPDMFGPLQINGRHVMMPLDINVFVLICNVDLFEAYGVPLPSPDWTWEECLMRARELTRPAEDVYGFYPIGLHHLSQAMIWQNGGHLFAPDGAQCLLDTDAVTDCARMLRDLGACAPPNLESKDLNGPPMASAFAAGRVAIVYHNRWFPEILRRLDTRVRWMAYPLPRGAEKAGVLHAYGMGLRRDSPVPELAKKFFRLAAGWEKWPHKIDHWYGMRLHADLERHDEVERAYKQMVRCARTPLSDVLPECRSKRQMEALSLVRSALERVVLSSEPVHHIMRHAGHTIDAMLNLHKHREPAPIGP